MTLTTQPRPAERPRPAAPAGPPPLENGDRLTRFEFERRWEAMPLLKKAELIEGVVYMAAALRHREHGQPHGLVIGWLAQYLALTPGLELSDNATLWLDADNAPQPDALLRVPEEAGGRSRVTDDGYIEGPPELIVEVASSSVSYDLHAKLNVYRRHGVPEYVVWRVLDQALDWFVYREGRYESIAPAADGLLKSEVFPGLWLDAPALLRGDLARALEVVRAGAAGPGHTALIERLRAGK